MDWLLPLVIIFGTLVVLLALGMPVAFAFMAINIIGVYFWWGGVPGLHQLTISLYTSISKFSLLPVSMFVLLSEVLFLSGVAFKAIDIVDMWIGRVPGRLSLVAVGAGTILAAISGSSLGTTALLGSTLLPEMRKRGYSSDMSLGPIMACGGLDAIIPPSALGVVLATIAQISIGKLLMSGFIPGFILAACYAAYIILRCYLRPSLAPPYETSTKTLSQKLLDSMLYVLPLAFIIAAVTVTIFIGVATPTEAAALGAFAAFILAALYKNLNWKVIKESIASTLSVTVMLLIILTGATVFSQILAYTGATAGLTQFTVSANLPPLQIIIAMQIVILIMGCFMEPVSILMITIPIFMPIVLKFNFDPLWFGLVTLINVETGLLTPPFGLILYTMKGVAPPDVTMAQIIRAIFPFVAINVAVILLIIFVPITATWLPSIMK